MTPAWNTWSSRTMFRGSAILNAAVLLLIMLRAVKSQTMCSSISEVIPDPRDEGLSVPSFGQTPQNLYIGLNNPIGCCGKLTLWEFCLNKRATNESVSLTLGIWRYSGSGPRYDLVHNDSYTVDVYDGLMETKFVCFNMTPSNDNVTVYSNDIFGIIPQNFSENLLACSGSPCSNVIIYEIPASEIADDYFNVPLSTQFTIPNVALAVLTRLNGSSEGCDIVTTAPQSFTEARTTATTPSTDPPTEAETNDLFVIIGACVGAGLLVVIVIVVVIILICCSRKGSDDSKADDVMVLNQMQRPPNDYQTNGRNGLPPPPGAVLPGMIIHNRVMEEQTYKKGSQTGVLATSTQPSDTLYEAPPATFKELLDDFDRRFQKIPISALKLTKVLGQGEFGLVHRGTWHIPGQVVDVAVKTIKGNSSEEEKIKFMQEASLMGQFVCPNIVRIHGICLDNSDILIVLEFMNKGDLKNLVTSFRPEPVGSQPEIGLENMLLNYCRQVAFGMNYLASKSFVHRDLAARNILVDGNNICKIADFGMSRDVTNENMYLSSGGKIPLKWTAPEAIQYRRYSSASDVWSFGILLYEIWSLGHKPYENMTNKQALEYVRKGYRLPPPPGCPRAIYFLMIKCWNPEARNRIPFADCVQYLSREDSELIFWEDDEEDGQVIPASAKVLGAELERGEVLYKDLQEEYLNKVNSPASPPPKNHQESLKQPEPAKEGVTVAASPYTMPEAQEYLDIGNASEDSVEENEAGGQKEPPNMVQDAQPTSDITAAASEGETDNAESSEVVITQKLEDKADLQAEDYLLPAVSM